MFSTLIVRLPERDIRPIHHAPNVNFCLSWFLLLTFHFRQSYLHQLRLCTNDFGKFLRTVLRSEFDCFCFSLVSRVYYSISFIVPCIPLMLVFIFSISFCVFPMCSAVKILWLKCSFCNWRCRGKCLPTGSLQQELVSSAACDIFYLH
jgi:hypothetical protein